jgi:hypothetical protein
MAAPHRKLLGNSIAREQWLLNEIRIVARLRLDGMDEKSVTAKVIGENLFRYPTEKTLQKISRACNKRIDALDDLRLVKIIASGMPDAAAQTNLYAMMQLYPLVRHFMTTEIARHYAELDYSFTSMDMNAYFTGLAADYENFATAADSTVSKLKQVLRKCLAEVGMVTADDKLQVVFLDPELEGILREHEDFAALASFGIREAL